MTVLVFLLKVGPRQPIDQAGRIVQSLFGAKFKCVSHLEANRATLAASGSYLHCLQLLETLLDKFLDLARVLFSLVLVKGISRSSLRVLAEVVGRKLLALAQ